MSTIPARVSEVFRCVPPATIGDVRTTGFVDPAIRENGSFRVERSVTPPEPNGNEVAPTHVP